MAAEAEAAREARAKVEIIRIIIITSSSLSHHKLGLKADSSELI